MFKVPVIPPSYDHVNGPRGATISHAYSGAAISPSEARDLARGLLDAADRAERLNSEVLPHLEAASAAVQRLRTDRTG